MPEGAVGVQDGGERPGWRGALLVLVCAGVLCVVGGGVMLAQVPGTIAEQRAYENAAVCPPGVDRSSGGDGRTGSGPPTGRDRPIGSGHRTGAGDGDHTDSNGHARIGSWPRSCVTKVAARVERMERRGRFSKRSLHVSELRSGSIPGGAGGGGRAEVRLLDSEPLYDAVLLGDRVTLSYWKGEVRTVSHGPLTQETEDSPANTWRVPIGIGFLATPFGLIMLLVSWSYRNRHPNQLSVAPGWPLAGVLMLLGAGLVGSFVSTDADHVRQVLLAAGIAAAVCAGLSPLLAWTMAWMHRRAADTSDVVPVRLAAPVCVAAEVCGEVPYSIDEFRFLLLGAGPPAVTSVPVEWSTPQELPASLAIREVRSFRPKDLPHWPSTYEYDGIVIECLDGEQVVLIACSRRDAPLILGALIHDRPAIRPWGTEDFGGTHGAAGPPGDPAPA